MSATEITALVVGLVVLIAIVLLAIFLVSRRRRDQRREQARQEFGGEYERTAEERGSEEEAESELRERREHVESEVRPLSGERREHYEERWSEVEKIFVDNPGRAVEMADRAVADLLDERNVVSDAAQSDEDTGRRLAATYPEAAGDYREARRVRADVVAREARGTSGATDEETTEDLRRTIRRYRSVYEQLLRS